MTDVMIITLVWNQPLYAAYLSRQSPPRACMMKTWFHSRVVEKLGQYGFKLAARLSFVASILEQPLSLHLSYKEDLSSLDVDRMVETWFEDVDVWRFRRAIASFLVRVFFQWKNDPEEAQATKQEQSIQLTLLLPCS